MTTSTPYKIVGYGICGSGEADRYLEATLKEFKRLCDETIIVVNNVSEKEIALIKKYGFHIKEDNREWGLYQSQIKNDLMEDVAKLNPDFLVCLDMDEVFEPEVTKERLLELFNTGDSLYFYIVNLWNEGWNRRWSFWNVRAWKWSHDTRFLNKPLHCGLAPEWCYYYASYAPHFIKHYGLMKKEDRQRKIERYQKYDPDGKYKDKSYYEALADDKNEPLDEEFIKESIVKEIGVQHKKSKHKPRERVYHYVQCPNGKVVDIPHEQLSDTLKRDGFKYVGVVGVPKQGVALREINVLECPICGHVARDILELNLHKHE